MKNIVPSSQKFIINKRLLWSGLALILISFFAFYFNWSVEIGKKMRLTSPLDNLEINYGFVSFYVGLVFLWKSTRGKNAGKDSEKKKDGEGFIIR